LQIAVKGCHYPITEKIIQHTIQTSAKEEAKKLVNQPNKVRSMNIMIIE
jgi:hypothetical protein